MDSFKGNGRERGPKRRQGAGDVRKRRPSLESLEKRTLLSIGDGPISFQPTSVDIADVKNGPLAKAGSQLISIYQEYQTFLQQGGGGEFVSQQAPWIMFDGDKVGVDFSGVGDFNAMRTSLANLGMDVTATDSTRRIVEGYIPIAQLVTASKVPQVNGMVAMFKPQTGSVGSATNQGEVTMKADTARTTFNVDGTGVKVGILSDSVSRFAGGLADSVRTGDLPNNVQVLLDGPAGSTDEGRAMLEMVHDIAPGAALAFNTAFTGEVGFANGIRALAQAGSQVIADDVGYATEPIFQDGIVAQAITDVTQNSNVTYLSLAHNSSNSGYQSAFRGVNATITGIGAGRFLDFDPGPGVSTSLPIAVTNPNSVAMLQWDNPFYVTNGVTTDLDFYFLDANGAVVGTFNTNNIAQNMPNEIASGLPATATQLVVQVAAGSPDPGRVAFFPLVNAGFTVDTTKFGNNGISYATVQAHSTSADAITVGAVPWWVQYSPQATFNPLTNEGFSSLGPATKIFTPDGTRLASPLTLQKPDVSAADGTDTSFFTPGVLLSTVTPPPNTGPATTVELDGNTTPNFFGTSAATPNAAGVVALMKQLAPSAKKSDILDALIASTVPLNSVPKGQWGDKGGFGLIQANLALSAIDTLRVVTATPSGGATLTTSPNAVVVTFNKPVDPTTLQASDLQFLTFPTGVTVTPGTPVLLNPTTVSFPLDIATAAGALANGSYTYAIADGAITSTDGKQLSRFQSGFALDDTTSPRVANTQFLGRTIIVQFTEAMRASTIDKTSVQLLLKTGATYTPVSDRFDATVSYDSANNRAIIDLSNVPQQILPSGDYAIQVSDTVTDLVGNRLDGEFSGAPPTGNGNNFPSGNGTSGGVFFQSQHFVLQAPIIISAGLAPASDSGIAGDQNTKSTRPTFTGRILNNFPGSLNGVTIAVQFNALHSGTFDLNTGLNNRGFVGTPDVVVTTDAQGNFTFQTPADLPDGFNRMRIVAVGRPDAPPQAGLSSKIDVSFRIDTTFPELTPNTPLPGSTLAKLSTIVINVSDPILPTDPLNPLVVPTQLSLPALDPTSANNISNYSLKLINPITGAELGDYSSYIISATFQSTTNRTSPTDPNGYTGTITLSVANGLPGGRYTLIARGPQTGFSGITDAAGNAIDGDGNQANGAQDFRLTIDLQPQAAFITSFQAVAATDGTVPIDLSNPATFVNTGPRSFYEITVPGVDPRAPAPPTQFVIDFSNPLQPVNSSLPGDPLNRSIYKANAVQLIRSANAPTAPPDGDFGLDARFGAGSLGFTRVAGVTITLQNSIPGATFGQIGYQNRLVVTIPAGTSLPADYYRFYMPNTGASAIVDLFGNTLDGEFLGDLKADGSFETLQPTGDYRTGKTVDLRNPMTSATFDAALLLDSGLTGDSVPGGAFETGFTIVPNGNVIYARPDYVDDPFLTGDDPDGSLAKPFAALAPEAIETVANGGDLNSILNFGTGFDNRLDRNQNGRFDRSALFAAQQRVQVTNGGPAVVVALPGIKQRDPFTGITTQATFVLAAPAGGLDPVANNASASIPANTMLSFAPGAITKLLNASILVQNQGSALQVRGNKNPEDQVIFTSFLDDSVGGDTNGDGSATSPSGGDWGGLVFRSYTQANRANLPNQPFPVDDRLKNAAGGDAISGADDAMSAINFGRVSFGGGPVPRTLGNSDGPITLFNSRPAITNSAVTDSKITGANGTIASGTVGAITADFDSFREDDLARGMLVRKVTLTNNSINGIFIRATAAGQARQTDAVDYVSNNPNQGGSRNFVIDDPVPHVLTTRLVIGEQEFVATGGQTQPVTNRLYIQPGMMFKMPGGAAIDAVTPGSSINIGDRTYIKQFDFNNNIAPTSPGFVAPTVGDAQVIFTSFYDDAATTAFKDPNTGQLTTIVAASDTDNGGPIFQPTPGNVPPAARWGGMGITSGARIFMDESQVRYAGGSVNTPSGTIGQRDALAFINAGGFSAYGNTVGANGTRAFITNNDFLDNNQAPMSIDADGLLAADPMRPLLSGNPFFRGNVMQRNTRNGLEVIPVPQNRNGGTVVGFVQNLSVDSVWDDTDLTYLLQSTILLNGAGSFFGGGFGSFPVTNLNAYDAEQKPFLTLTIQSNLPDTLLANGQRVPRPGESALVKLLNDPTVPPIGDGQNGMPVNNNQSDTRGGAGFMAGFDDGSDPTTDPTLDSGAYSQIRIVGISGNETTGQQRVPVLITSMRDDTLGKTVRGIDMFQAINGNTTAPAAGDGGVIGFGGLTLSDYNLLDPRDGNIIDNADIRYITRVEQQGGGIVDLDTGSWADVKAGISSPAAQLNTAKAMTISNSNFSNFSQVGVISRPAGVTTLVRDPSSAFGGVLRDPTGRRGEGTLLYLVNNTFSNMPMAVRINSETVDNPTNEQSPAELVALNNTFYNTPIGISTSAPAFNNQNSRSHVYYLAMDNVFDTNTTAALEMNGQVTGSQAQYNLFSNSTQITGGFQFYQGNHNAIVGNALFRDPANRDFTLLQGSDAIDDGLSELGQTSLGNSLQPIADQILAAVGGIRNTTGRTNGFGGLFSGGQPGDIVTLPGFDGRTFKDQWVAALPGTPGAVPGPATNGANFWYLPVSGQRDQLGFLRVDDPSTSRVGAGRNPFYDLGALERRIIVPPHVTDVTAILPDASSPTGTRTQNFYVTGGTAGSNEVPNSLKFKFDGRLDPNTINSRTVILQASGGDGIFGNANNSADRSIDLSGKLVWDANTQTITVNVGAITPSLGSDLYRITLFGNGSDVLRDQQGNALDGENTQGASPTGAQLALPSGNNIPGGNFYVSFTLDTNPPSLVPNTLRLDAASDTGRPGDNITSQKQPTFTGTIQDIFPPSNPLAGQTVYLDYAGADGVFGTADDIQNAGSAITTANGTFTVTVGVDGANTGLVTAGTQLPDTNFNVGADGYLGPNPNTGVNDDPLSSYSLARVRIVDQAGNASNPTPADLSNQVRFVVDTRGPRITGSSLAPNAQATVLPGGLINVVLTTNENINPATLNAGSIQVYRSGGDAIFGSGGTKPDVQVPVQGTITVTPIPGTTTGAQNISFTISGVNVNDIYRITLLGSSNAAVTDWAGNALDGEFTGLFPSGNDQPGGDFNLDFVVLSSAIPSRTFFVSAGGSTTGTGSRTNPFSTITAGLAAAGVGDTVAVLPGVYNESVDLKSLVQVVSASPSSTDLNVIPGQALQTIIRPLASPTGPTVGVSATNLFSLPNFETELAGFTIAIPLLGNVTSGPIDTSSVGIAVSNSDVLIDKNYVINAGIGIRIATSGFNAATPRIESNGVIGNINGLVTYGAGTITLKDNQPVRIANNTFAFNTSGVVISASPSFTSQVYANIDNNIFAQNFATSGASRSGFAIRNVTNTVVNLRANLISNNGASANSYTDDIRGVPGFNTAKLGTTPDANGNFVGNPAFANPRDPRPSPQGTGPNTFFLDANFDLGAASAAIDVALQSSAPTLDFRYRGRTNVAGKGRIGYGPADIGAFEYRGTGGIPGLGSNGTPLPTTGAKIKVGAASVGSRSSVQAMSVDLALSNANAGTLTPTGASNLNWVDNETVNANTPVSNVNDPHTVTLPPTSTRRVAPAQTSSANRPFGRLARYFSRFGG